MGGRYSVAKAVEDLRAAAKRIQAGRDARKHQAQKVLSVPVGMVRPCYGQPREDFAQDRLVELADSLRTHGQIQPATVRRLNGDDGKLYELVDGERRWRALQLIDEPYIRVLVVHVDDSDSQYVAAVVANSAREELSPVEKSRAVARIAAMPEFANLPTKEALWRKLGSVFGHSHVWVRDMLKLDQVAPEVKTLVENEQLTVATARHLADVQSPERQAEIGQRVAKQKLRGPAAENAVKEALKVEQLREGRREQPRKPGAPPRNSASNDARVVAELVGRIHQSGESLLDMPSSRLREAYTVRPADLDKTLKAVREAITALEQLRDALACMPAPSNSNSKTGRSRG
jgi:ParB family transcriptional regulator, chromosome partitioning protein